jgi:hypothetical protein
LIEDRIRNDGYETTPLMLLYHINIGYPLLSENAELWIPSSDIIPRDTHAKAALETWSKIIPPTAGFEEECFYHHFSGKGMAAIYNNDIGSGLSIEFDRTALDYLIQWKMMGEIDYILGLEPANCHSAGRDKMRQQGDLKMIGPGEERTYQVLIRIIENRAQWDKLIGQD